MAQRLATRVIGNDLAQELVQDAASLSFTGETE